MIRTLGRACRRPRKHVVAYPNHQYAFIHVPESAALLLSPSTVRQRHEQSPWLRTQIITRSGLVTSPHCSTRVHSIRYWSRQPATNIRWNSTKTQSGEHQQDTSKHESTQQPNDHSRGSQPFIASDRALSKSILITGGTSGIGFQVAKRALLEGASRVRIVTRDAKRGVSTVDQLRLETATDAHLDYVTASVDEYSDPKLFDLPPSHPPITTAIHCAGITQTSLLSSTPSPAIRDLLHVNLESTALLARALLKRHVRATRDPASSQGDPSWQFITVSSLLATKSGAGASVYAATKAGQIALTRALCLEGAQVARRGRPAFRANVVVPGYIDTPMTKGIAGASRDALLQDIPAARFGGADEVADAVVFLLRNEYANNCVLNLDGGLSAT